MGIFLKGDDWFIDYYARGRRKREKIGSSKALAENVLRKRKLALAENKFLDIKKHEKIKFEDFANTFIELHSKPNKKPSSVRRDLFSIKKLSTFFAGKYIHDITTLSVEKYKSLRTQEAAPATLNRELACLKCMFNKGIKWGKIDHNPVRDVNLLKENNQILRYLEKDQIPRLIDNCPDYIKPIVTLAVFTGMRKSEVLNLKWADVDLERGLIHLHDTKNGESRKVFLNNRVTSVLRDLKRRPDSPYVFCNEEGKPYNNIKKSFVAALKKIGIINFRFHDLRHTFASQLVMSGIDLNTVRELMGHKSLEMTLRYAHLSPDHKRHAVHILERKMDTFWTPRGQEGVEGKIVDLLKYKDDREIKKNRPGSSMAEQWFCKPPVEGSNPFLGLLVNSVRYPSGQREQTVNLPALPSKVRILLSPFFYSMLRAGIRRSLYRLSVPAHGTLNTRV